MAKITCPSIKDISLENIGWRKDHILTPSTQATLKIEFSKYNNTEVIVEYVLYPEAFNVKLVVIFRNLQIH